ncbi:hypothetical protein [Allosphingosinicella sp.]|uniref:hypothetical protein n=1 Tax=Allosphingosinicella sp. TaxID=2823234 RepID=UPI002FC1A6E5
MQPLTNDATTTLLRAIRVTFVNFDAVIFEEIVSRGWASVTFTGARHEIALRLDGEGADGAASAFLAHLETTEFRLRGHVLADIALVSEERSTRPDGAPRIRIRLEALTVEDG